MTGTLSSTFAEAERESAAPRQRVYFSAFKATYFRPWLQMGFRLHDRHRPCRSVTH